MASWNSWLVGGICIFVVFLGLSSTAAFGTPFDNDQGYSSVPLLSTAHSGSQTPFLMIPESVDKILAASSQAVGKTSSTVSKPTEYVVRAGDFVSKIAREKLGDPARYIEIIRLNADRYPSLLKNPNLIYVGWKLVMPEKTPPVASTTTTTSKAISASAIPTSPPHSSTSAVAPSGISAPSTDSTPTSETNTGDALFTSSQRILHIGDSHTVGIYGSTFDSLLRETGAKVMTVGVAGSSPGWYLNGTVTKCGFFSRDIDEVAYRPADWREPVATPLIGTLIEKVKPGIIIVSLGANLVGASDSRIQTECRRLIEALTSANALIIWIGPPNSRSDKKTVEAQKKLCTSLKNAVTPFAAFVDSSSVTPYPATGGDGIHFSGAAGTRIARAWAQYAFDQANHSTPPTP
ncbi:MAG: hypothetical protein WA705_06625 [Candidatus Ozemobacteraceae bacterium]